MVIQHNIPALNSHRFLGVNNNAAAKNLEKLSSGYKINRAGDDAAGLAISEKMRTAINGLSKAEDNTSNAINLIQTAEGGMQELQSILQKMSELATQATNGTYANEVDREGMDLEFQQLKEEFNRIRDYTNYNGIKLLNGDPFSTESTAKAKTISSISNLAGGANAGDIVNLVKTAPGTTAVTAGSFDIELVYGANGAITGNIYNAGTTTSAGTVTLNQLTGKLDVTTTAAATGNALTFSIDGDWIKGGNADNVRNAKITIDIGAAGNTAADLPEISVKSVSGYAGDLVTDVVTTTAVATTKTGTPTNTKTNVDIDLLFGDDGKVDVAATNKALKAAGIYNIEVSLSNSDADLEIKVSESSANYNVVKFTGGWAAASAVDGIKSMNLNFTFDATTAGSIAISDIAAKITAAGAAGAADGAPVGQGDTGDMLVFQVGARGTADQQVKLRVADMAAMQLGMGTDLSGLENLGTVDENGDADGRYTLVTYGGDSYDIDITNEDSYKDLTVEDMHILDKNAANIAIEVVKTAIDDVSLKRANLGAVQNRLEYTLNNLGVTKENLTASESTIRDVDMAKEMMEFTKNSILIQSAQAMLAQANTLPQGVLQLLR